jgi:hypothetical protein
MMRRIFATLCLLVLVVFLFSACGEETYEAPDGFYVATDPKRDGCYFVVPEGWTFTSIGGNLMARVSNLNSANVTVSFVSAPDAESVSVYWAENEDKFSTYFDEGTYQFGKLSETRIDTRVAYLYEYEASYEGIGYRFMQYIVMLGEKMSDGLCIITCTASTAKNVGGDTDFEDQYETFLAMVDNFRFADAAPVAGDDLSDLAAEAPEGMKLASNPTLLGLALYVPTYWTVGITGGYVNARLDDGANLGVSAVDYQAAYDKMAYYGLTFHDENGFTLYDYWNVIKAEYGAYLTDFVVVEEPINGEEITPVRVGDTTYYRFIFRGVRDGVEYEMTLYVFRKTSDYKNKFYTALYTASAEVAPLHREAVESVLGEVKY